MGKERRKFSAEFKLDTVLEGIRGEKSIAEICRERDITDSLCTGGFCNAEGQQQSGE